MSPFPLLDFFLLLTLNTQVSALNRRMFVIEAASRACFFFIKKSEGIQIDNITQASSHA